MPSENFTPDATPVEPVVPAPDAFPVGDAYAVAFAEQVEGIDDSDTGGMELVEMEPPAPELDAQGEAMMHPINETPNVVNLGNELSPVEQSSVSAPTVAEEVSLTPTTEASPEQKVSKEIPPDIASAYAERFGINPEDLKNMEGFSELSRGQQKQVLENLAQLTIGRIHEEAADGHDKDIALEKANASKLGSKFLGKVWVGMKDSFTKKFDIVNREKKAVSEIQKGGMAQHEVVLRQMVDGMKKFGPAIKEGPNGELEVQFIETDGLNPDAKATAEAFNAESTKLSKIPYEWSLDTASKEQQNAFKEAKEAYESTRDGLLMIMKESAGEGGEARAVTMMAQTESQIEMQRFMQTAPDAAEELSKIEDQNAWTAAMKSVGTERGLYIAGGAIARAGLGAMAGFVAAPVVAFGSAAIRGWKRTGEELKTQDVKQRKGEAPAESAKTAETRAMIAKLNESIANTTDENLKDQLKMDLYELNKSLRGTEKNMITSSVEGDIAGDKVAESGDRRRGATAKIDYLKVQIASVEEMLMTGPAADEAKNLEDKKAKLTAQLSRRLDYTKQKISEGNMVFGDEKVRLGNQYALMRSMAEAEMNLATETAIDEKGDKVRERLARMLNATGEQIKDARFNKKLTQAIKAGAIGGAFAGIGASAVDLCKWMNGGDSAIRDLVMGARGADAELGAMLNPDDVTPEINSASIGTSGVNAEVTPMVHPGLSTEGTLPHEALGAYAVKPGDTMTSILRAKFPGITDTQIENLRSHDLSALGIKNIDKINIDQKIDLDKMGEVLKAGKGSGVALRTPPAGGIVDKMFADEPTDFRGGAHELTDPIHTPTRVTTEPFPPNTVVPPRVRGAGDAELVSRTTTPAKTVSTEVVNQVHENTPPTASPRETILEQETGVQATTHLERPSGLYEAKVARIDNARAEALREAEAWHKRKLADLARRHDGGIVKDNVGTVNKGIKNIVNVLTGRQDGDRAISSMTREITGRVQGGITDEMKYAQAIEKANFDYQSKIARAEEAFTRARIKLDEREMETAAKEAAKAAKDAARLATRTKAG